MPRSLYPTKYKLTLMKKISFIKLLVVTLLPKIEWPNGKTITYLKL